MFGGFVSTTTVLRSGVRYRFMVGTILKCERSQSKTVRSRLPLTSHSSITSKTLQRLLHHHVLSALAATLRLLNNVPQSNSLIFTCQMQGTFHQVKMLNLRHKHSELPLNFKFCNEFHRKTRSIV